MADTSAARSRRYRDRKARRLPPHQTPVCTACGAGASGQYGTICRRCWERLTPEGRAAKAARVAKARKRKRDRL
jgi:hypothetical protein